MGKVGRPKGSFKAGSIQNRALRFPFHNTSEVVGILKDKGYMNDDNSLTQRGFDWAEQKLRGLGNGELVLIEKFFAERFNHEITYNEDES